MKLAADWAGYRLKYEPAISKGRSRESKLFKVWPAASQDMREAITQYFEELDRDQVIFVCGGQL